MKLRFMGEDGSMGLKNGEVYETHIFIKGEISVGGVESQPLCREILPLLLYQSICAELGTGK